MRRNFGYIQSPRDDRDSIFGVPKGNKLPVEYQVEDLPGVVNQGDDPICAAICLSHIMEWHGRIRGVRDRISPYKVFDLRSDKDMQGMIPREALSALQKKGVDGRKIGHYARVTNVTDAKFAIIMNGPIMICVGAYDKDKFWEPGAAYLGGHAVLLTGWDSDGFVLQNSWGYEFGNNGCVTFPEKDWVYVMESWTVLV